MAYALGQWEFRESVYKVGPGVLIPRPETELLIESAMDFLEQHQWEDSGFIGIELGTGSGIISIELAKKYPKTAFYSWEKSKTAYRYASINKTHHRTENLTLHLGNFFHQKSLWEPLFHTGKPVLFLSNPPYIPTEDIKHLDAHVKNFEPKTALDGGKSGLVFYKKIVQQLCEFENTGFVMEIGIHQEQLLRSVLEKKGVKDFKFEMDFQGIPRILSGLTGR